MRITFCYPNALDPIKNKRQRKVVEKIRKLRNKKFQKNNNNRVSCRSSSLLIRSLRIASLACSFFCSPSPTALASFQTEINTWVSRIGRKRSPLDIDPLPPLARCIAGGTGRPLILGVFDNNCQVNKKKSLPQGRDRDVVKKKNKKSMWCFQGFQRKW